MERGRLDGSEYGVEEMNNVYFELLFFFFFFFFF